MRTARMTSEIIIGVLSFLGTVIGSYSGLKLTSYRVEQLEKKVDKHNNFAERIPVIQNDIKTIYHKIDELERSEKNDNI